MDEPKHSGNGNGSGEDSDVQTDPSVIVPYVSQEDFVAAVGDEAPSVWVPSADGVTTYAGGQLDDLVGRQLADKLEKIPGRRQGKMLEERAQHLAELAEYLQHKNGNGNGTTSGNGNGAASHD